MKSIMEMIKRSFRQFYDHIFKLGGVSLLWFLIVAPLSYVGVVGLFLKMPIPFLINLVFVGPLTIGAFYMTNLVIKRREVTIKAFFKGFSDKKYFLKGMFSYWLSLFIAIVLGFDLIFFMNMTGVFKYITGLWIYLIIFFVVSQFYFWSLLVETEDGIFKSFKKSLLLVLDNPLYSLVLFLAFLLIMVVGVVTVGVGLAITLIGITSIMANNATYNLLVKYDLREEITTSYNND
mgnify:CR=1 FL=1